LPWTPTNASAQKGIAWKPSAKSNLDPETIETLLTAIAKARAWMNDIAEGRVESFDDIATTENKVERHVRFLAPLAFLSPRIIEAIANGSAPADHHVTVANHRFDRRASRFSRRSPHGRRLIDGKCAVAFPASRAG
jgi:hypothetical protein